MRNPLVLWLVLAVVVLAEWYGYQAVRTVVQHFSPNARRAAAIGYWLLTAGSWMVAAWAGSTRQSGNVQLNSDLMSLPVLLLGVLNLLVILFVIQFAALGNLALIGILAGFSALLSVFIGVYQSRMRRSEAVAAHS